MNEVICLTTTLLVIRVVVGGWKSLVFTTIQSTRDAFTLAKKVSLNDCGALGIEISILYRKCTT